MYLSRLLLNPRSRQVQREVADPYQRHRSIMSGFPADLPENERVLHRLERGGDRARLTLLVQSINPPDWSWLDEEDYLLPQDPFDALPNPQVKSFELGLESGQDLLFRLVANPTVKKKRPGRRHSNRVPLVREERQREWLASKADQHGFKVHDVRLHSEGERQGWIRGEGQDRHRLTLYMVQYDGALEVTDPRKIETAVREGIGPGKAFGCGLLSLAPPR